MVWPIGWWPLAKAWCAISTRQGRSERLIDPTVKLVD